MHVRWIFVFSSACGSRARARDGAPVDLEALGENRRVAAAREAVAVDRAHRRPRRRKRRCALAPPARRLPAPAKTDGARARDRAREAAASSATTTGSARLTAAGTAGSSGSSKAIFASSACSMSLVADAAGGAEAVGDERDALTVEAEAVDRLEPDADVLQRRHLGIADEQQLVGVIERGEHRGVEQRARVDDDGVVGVAGSRRARRRARPGRPRPPPRAAAARAARRRPSGVGADERLQLVAVDVAGRGGEVGDRRPRRDRQRERGVAELQVEVDEQRPLARARQPRPRGSSPARSCRCRPSARRR